MPVGFGFSVGDFVAGIVLVKDLIRALDESSGSSAEYRNLINELESLKWALELLQELQIDESQRDRRRALEQVAFQCWNIIENFVRRTAKFNAALGDARAQNQPGQTQLSKWRVALKKAQWSLNKKEDIAKVRAEIMGHTLILNALMSQMQLHAHEIQG